MFLMLDKLRGNPAKLNNWLLIRKLEVFKNEANNSQKVASFMYFAMMAFLVMPFIILLLWSILIMYHNTQEKEPATAGFCILIVGLAAILFIAAVMKVKWNNFRFKNRNVVYMVLALALITLYQVLIVFTYKHVDTFFPYSALFLNFNVTILAIAVYLSKFDKNSDVKSIFDKAFPKRGV